MPACQRWLAPDSEPTGSFFSTGVHSDYLFHFINEVQRGLNRTHPDRGIITLAYASHARMPRKAKLDPRVAVQFCCASNRSPASRGEYENEVRMLKA